MGRNTRDPATARFGEPEPVRILLAIAQRSACRELFDWKTSVLGMKVNQRFILIIMSGETSRACCLFPSCAGISFWLALVWVF